VSKIYFLGDLHFNDRNEWSIPSIEKFIEWFHSLKIPPNSFLIQLGDVFDKAANYGITIKLVTQFFRIASEKFKQVYVLGGNHDFSFRKEHYQYATNYLKESFKNVQYVYDEMILEIDGQQIGMLPFKKIPGKILDKYYSEELNEFFYNCDIICGHIAIEENNTFFGGININKFNPKTNFILGHIHTRNGPNRSFYTGSIMPFKINEANTEDPRCICVYDINKKSFDGDIYIPEILKFETAFFGDELYNTTKPDDGVIRLYTIKNCKHLHEAKTFYPKHYIYNVEKPIQVSNITVSKQNLLMTPEEAFNLMLKEQGIILKRKTMQVVKELLNENK
jgi:DNA repair exonuclease SbcCD nuclease subunit